MNVKKEFDVGILLHSTDYSFEAAEHFIDVEMNRLERLKSVTKDTYVLTIDARDYSGKIGAVHIPLKTPTKSYVKHLAFLLKSFIEINSLIKKNKDKSILLVSRSTFLAGMVIAVLSKIHHIPSVVFYQFDWTEWKRRDNILNYLFARIAQKISLNHASTIIVTAPYLKRRIISRGYDPKNVHVIPNHIDTTIFHPVAKITARKKLGMEEEEKNIFFAGRFAEQKNLFVLLGAMRELKDMKLYLAGRGKQEQDIKRFVEENRIGGRVIFLGSIPRERIAEYLNACNFFVLPSLYEGHPKVLLEAMACGCAIVASDVEGNKDVIRDNVEGLLFDSKSGSDLSDKIKSILGDKGLEERIREKALDSSKRYDPSSLTEREKHILTGLAT